MGLSVACPEKPNTPEFAGQLRAIAPDLAVVVAYGHLIRPILLSIPEHGFVNLHASLLPAYRGAAPVPWAILRGETTSGASVFRLDEKFDTGAVIGSVELGIADNDTSGMYLAKLAPLGAELMARSVASIAAGTAVARVQDDAVASAAPKFVKGDGRIDWSRPFAEIERRVRAFQPWPLAFTVLRSAKGEVRVNVIELCRAEGGGLVVPGGIVSAAAKSGLVVMTGDGPARVARLQPEGRRVMSDVDFLRGSGVLVTA
jgi:methionyl-tRNA formyltransferase